MDEITNEKGCITIGVSKFDKEAAGRRLEAKYALNSAAGVRLLLADYHALKNRQYCGDYDAICILVDLETAVSRAGLTDRQREAVRLVYEEDLTQVEAGRRMGVRQEAIKRHIAVSEAKIASVYEYWARRGEGYKLDETTEAEAV